VGVPGGGARGAAAEATTAPAVREARADEPDFRPIATPLSVSGVTQGALNELAEQLRPFGLIPVRGGGGGGRKSPNATVTLDQLKPGAPVGVELVRGDMSAVAMGTLTYLQGDTLVAFG